ncbi:MAG: hypothetical protein JXR70_09640 [Spirochaetales bacterium]|nr:hypothetical protein [Spirochaetales bacterium]
MKKYWYYFLPIITLILINITAIKKDMEDAQMREEISRLMLCNHRYSMAIDNINSYQFRIDVFAKTIKAHPEDSKKSLMDDHLRRMMNGIFTYNFNRKNKDVLEKLQLLEKITPLREKSGKWRSYEKWEINNQNYEIVLILEEGLFLIDSVEFF